MSWLAVTGLMLVMFSLVVSRSSETRSLERRILMLNRKLDIIAEHLGVAPEDEMTAQVRQLLVTGQKIQAIKFYRQATGARLGEAKQAVDRIELM